MTIDRRAFIGGGATFALATTFPLGASGAASHLSSRAPAVVQPLAPQLGGDAPLAALQITGWHSDSHAVPDIEVSAWVSVNQNWRATWR